MMRVTVAHLLKRNQQKCCEYWYLQSINLQVPDAEKQDQLGKESSAANDLGVFEEINKENMSEEELGPAYSVNA